MNLPTKFVLFTICFLLIQNTFFGQQKNGPLEKLVDRYNKFYGQSLIEKVFVQTDKSIYIAGETIWYKTNVLFGNNKPDTLSVPVYVELWDIQKNKVVLSEIVKSKKGFGQGNFDLPDTLSAKVYKLRAYTHWMRNYGEEYFYTKDITIFDDKPSESNSSNFVNFEDVDAQFFVEGGQLVENIDSKIAFKITDIAGTGIEATLNILNRKNDTLQIVKANQNGMGFFYLTPLPNETYKAEVVFREINAKIINLPIAQKEGVSIRLNNLTKNNLMHIAIQKSDGFEEDSLIILGQNRKELVLAKYIQFKQNSQNFTLQKDQISEGLTVWTIYNKYLEPLVERLSYKEFTDTLAVNVYLEKQKFLPKENIFATLKINEANGKPAQGNFMVVVSDGNQVEVNPHNESLMSYLLLSSEIKGKIEKPSQYFDPRNKNRMVDMDLLLQTQGWRRYYKPKELPKTKYEHFLEMGLTVAGKANKPNGKLHAKPVKMSMMFNFPDKNKRFDFITADSLGNFIFPADDLQDTTGIFIQALVGRANGNVNISLENHIIPPLWVNKNEKNNIINEINLAAYLKKAREYVDIVRRLRKSDTKMLSEVTIKAKKTNVYEAEASRYGTADVRMDMDQEPIRGVFNIFALIQGRFAGVQVSGDIFNPEVSIRGLSSISSSNEPLFLLDGMPVDKEMIASIPVQDVKFIDVVKTANAGLGSQGSNGAISIITRKGGEQHPDYLNAQNPGTYKGRIRGYGAAKEFFVPKYEDNVFYNNIPDNRATIYWKANVELDKTGTAILPIKLSQDPSNIKIRVEGIDKKGKMALYVK